MYKYLIISYFLFSSVHTAYTQVFRQPGFKKTRSIVREIASSFQFNMESGYSLGTQSQKLNTKESSAIEESKSAISRSVPLAFSMNYKYKNYKLGIYYGFHFLTTDSYQLGSNQPNYKSVDVTNTLLAGYFGYELTFYKYWTHTPEIRIGSYSFNETGAKTSGITYDLGVNIEHHFSEVVRARIRPSIEFVSYTASDPITSIDIGRPTYHLAVGLSFNIGRLPRCKIPRCAAKIDHLHPMFFTNEFRSNRHNVLIEQNPMHGEHSRKRWDILNLIFRKNKTFEADGENKEDNVITHILSLIRKDSEDESAEESEVTDEGENTGDGETLDEGENTEDGEAIENSNDESDTIKNESKEETDDEKPIQESLSDDEQESTE